MTEKLSSPTVIHELLDRYGLHFNKQFGQNFLTDANTVERIADAAQIGPEDVVLEVGPGIGTLTAALADRAHHVISVEIDKKLIPVLHETMADRDNVTIVCGDILKTDLHELLAPYIAEGRHIRIAANLPYYITTPVIMNFLESGIPFAHMSFLVQKEVGERIAGKPGTKAYGSLSVAAQYYANVAQEFTVPATVFVPKPKVDSAVITLSPRSMTDFEHSIDRKNFLTVVRAAFGNRRKTLLNSLFMNTGIDKETLTSVLTSCGIDPGVRAEKLSSEDFAKIADALYK